MANYNTFAIPSRQNNPTRRPEKTPVDTLQIADEETKADSAATKNRWKVQRTTPISYADLKGKTADLKQPDNLRSSVEYNDTLNRYIIGAKMGPTYLAAPIMMTPEEYRTWSQRQARNQYFRTKNNEIYQAKGKEKFDFTDMHFDLGPA